MAKVKIDLKGTLERSGGTAVGAIGGAYIDKISFVSTLSPIVKGLGKIALGAIVPGLIFKSKVPAWAGGVGDGMVAVGSLQLANATVFKASPVTISGLPTLGDYEPYNAAALHGGEQGGGASLQTLGNAGGMDNY